MLMTRLRADALTARKTKSIAAGVLVTLLGEIDTKTKTLNPARDLTDEEVLAVVKKFLKNLDETLRVLTPAVAPADKAAAALEKALAEKAALEVYLPQQMTAEELAAFAQAKIAEGANLGAIMAALKAERGGQYDGKLASDVVRGLMAKA